MQLLDNGVHDNTKVVIGGRCQKREQQYQNNHPQDRKPNACIFGATVLKIPEIEDKENTYK